MSKITQYVRHLAVVAIATLLAQCAWAAATPKLLINFGTTTETTGWVTHTQTSPNSGMIPKGGGYLEQNGVKFSTTSAGNFFDNNWSATTTDLPTEGGAFVDVDGTEHASLVEEIETSLGLTSGTLTTDIYKTGLMNGGQQGHTATIAGLSAASKYVIYVGYGLKKNDDANQTSGIRISSSGYSSCGAREYVVTVAGTGTTVATQYQSFNENTSIKPGSQGLMVVRLDDVVPTAAGEVKFTMYGDRAGINWLAVAEKSEKIPTAELTASGETSWTAVVNGADLTDKVVTLKLGGDTTITLDAAKPSMTSFSVALADGVEAATLKFVAKSALWMPGAVGEGVTFTGLEINAETDQSVRTADLTIAANETVLVNGTTLGKVTNNGTLNVTGDSTFKLANNGTANLVSGTSTISADSQAIKGTINIAYGATYKCANNDQVPYGGSVATTINVRGTLDMQNHRWTLGGADTINLYGGCTVSGQGDNDGLFDLYRDGNIINVQAGEGDQAEVKVVTLPAPIRARHSNGNIFIAQGMKLALTGGIKKADNNTSVVNMNGNGRLTGTVALTGGFTLNLGNAVGTIDAKFVAEGGTTALKLGEGAASTQITTSDSKDNPIVLVKSGATLDLYVKDFSSWNQAVTQYGWIKNEGALNIYEYATTQSRYFRGHLVMKPGTTTTLYGTSQNFIVYGGNSDVTKAQMIVPASETETTTTFAGEGTIQLNVSGSGGTPGSAWDIGENSTLDVTAKVIGGEAIAKYGEGTLKFSNTENDYTGTITLKAGTIVVPSKLGDDKVVTDVEGKKVAFDEATNTYSLENAEIIFTIEGALPEHTVAYVQYNGEATYYPIQNGQFTAKPGDKFVVYFTVEEEGYAGNLVNTGIVTVIYPMQQTTIPAPTAEAMGVIKVVAMIEDYAYGSLKAALDDAEAGDTITLSDNDSSITTRYQLTKSVTLNLNGKNITASERIVVSNNATLTVNAEGSTISGLRIDAGKNSNDCGNIIINKGTWTANEADTVFHVNGTCTSANVTITGATITSPTDNGIQLNGKGVHTITDCTITGATAIYVKAGAVSITGCTIVANGEKGEVTVNNNGSDATGDAIVLDNCVPPYPEIVSVTIATTTITSANGSAVLSHARTNNTRQTKILPAALKANITEAVATSADLFDDYSEGPKDWADVEDVTTVLPEETTTTVTTDDLVKWATDNGVTFEAGITIPVNALIFNTTPAAVQATDFVAEEAASEVLEEVIEAEKLDLAALLAKATEAGEGGLTITSLSEKYPMATIKLVESTKISSDNGKFFQLSIELK
ncbi:MAG: right-handed parallel beta-helix repeat-containing protein [Kiritimatiellae bacterium]|nr:right-handed parallel beta-helix repeat-containing protein [Kiritimatiellia bacterium]